MPIRKPTPLARTARAVFVALTALSFLLGAYSFPQINAGHIQALYARALGIQETPASTDISPKRLPKIIDLFLFNGEFDFLDIRLHELYHYVDFFAVAESEETFRGTPKPLYFKDNMHRFEKFMDKIHYVQVPPLPPNHTRASDVIWGRELYTRDKAFKMVVDDLQIQEGDWVIISDTDEIIRPSILQTMRFPDPEASSMDEIFVDRPVDQGGSNDLVSFDLQNYRYAYDVYVGTIAYPVAVRYREKESLLQRVALNGSENDVQRRIKERLALIGEDDWANAGQWVRNSGSTGLGNVALKVDDAGWHCSWCFNNMSQFQAKIGTYGHREYDTPEHRTQEYIISNIANGTDFSGKPELPVFLERVDDIPEFVRKNKERFSYMLTRRGKPNAGLLDVKVEDVPSSTPPQVPQVVSEQ